MIRFSLSDEQSARLAEAVRRQEGPDDRADDVVARDWLRRIVRGYVASSEATNATRGVYEQRMAQAERSLGLDGDKRAPRPGAV